MSRDRSSRRRNHDRPGKAVTLTFQFPAAPSVPFQPNEELQGHAQEHCKRRTAGKDKNVQESDRRPNHQDPAGLPPQPSRQRPNPAENESRPGEPALDGNSRRRWFGKNFKLALHEVLTQPQMDTDETQIRKRPSS